MASTAANSKGRTGAGAAPRSTGKRSSSSSSSSSKSKGHSGTTNQRSASSGAKRSSSTSSSSSSAAASSGKGAAQAQARRRRKNSQAPLIITILAILLIIVAAVVYMVGYVYYKDKFTANVFVNGTEVSGMSYDEAKKLFAHTEVPQNIRITTPQDKVIEIPLSGIGYKYSADEELEKIYNDLDKRSWFANLMHRTDYEFADTASYDREKFNSAVESADWGDQPNVSAQLKSNDDGYYVIPEVQGDVFDMEALENYIASNLDNAVYEVNAFDSGAYVTPETVSADYDKKAETLNRLWNISINYDFNYTTETLTGKKLVKLVKVDRDGEYTVDRDACMTYIEKIAKKYDTYDTVRTFKSTLQGKIKVDPSSDAKYGWWMDKEECCDQLVRMLKKGKTRKSVTPIYYNHEGYFEFTGVPEARTAKDDIGKTYIEVDLSNQQWWYYKKGKQIRTGYIVSGQTTSITRTTLEGVYKLWAKDMNHRMKDSNADGESWDSTCNYWNNISLCGIGMHDSTWRGAFGGNIYTYDGSHGCINMTLADAEYIYENIPLGTPVVMYYQ